jgi:hypothetical protein
MSLSRDSIFLYERQYLISAYKRNVERYVWQALFTSYDKILNLEAKIRFVFWAYPRLIRQL